MSGHEDSLLERWGTMPPEVRTEALNGRWYRESRRAARALARKHDVTVSVAAGVIAALSPRIRWNTNVAAADKLLAGAENENVAGYNANIEKARRIAKDGERPLDVLGGPKVRAFYRAIMGDSESVVVDMWMARAMGVDPAAVSAMYDVLAGAITSAARSVGIAPANFQAVVWAHIRGDNAEAVARAVGPDGELH